MVARAGSGLLSPIGQRVTLDGRPYPLTLATVVLVGSGLFATPTFRPDATRVSPVVALRSECDV